MRMVPPSMVTAVSEWMPSSSASMVRVPPAMVMSPAVWMASSALVMVMLPLSTYRQPPSLETAMPSSPASSVRLAAMMRRLSFTWMASWGAVTVMVPPVMTRSSLAAMPCLYPAVTVREPEPLMVRSSWAKMAPSAPSARAASE